MCYSLGKFCSERRRRENEGPCDCGCDQRRITEFHANLHTMLQATACDPEHVPEFDLAALDPSTSKPVAGEVVKTALYPYACAMGECKRACPCGWNKVFGSCPEQPALEDGGDTIRACKRDADATQTMDWNTWQRVPRAQPPPKDPSDPTYEPPGTGDDKVGYNTYWFPVVGTRLEFMHHLRESWLAYRVHAWWKTWHRVCSARRVQRCFVEPAVLGATNVQPWQRNWVLAHVDFSAVVKVTRLAEATGAFQETSEMLTMVITANPRLQLVSDLDEGRFRQALEADGVVSYPTADTLVVYAMSDLRHCANYYGSVLPQVLEWAHTGRVPERSEMEFVSWGVRQPGSDTSRELGQGLVDFDPATMQARQPFIQTGHSGKPLVQIAEDGKTYKLVTLMPGLEDCTNLDINRDGSLNDFAGLHGLLVLALLENVTGVRTCDTCCQAEDGKGPSDGANVHVTAGVKRLVRENKNPGSGARGLFELVAAHRQGPRVERQHKRALTSVSEILYVYLDKFVGFEAECGYKGSRKDHAFDMVPATRGKAGSADEGVLRGRHRPCPCDRCLQGDYGRCLVTRLFPNPHGTHRLARKANATARANTRARTTMDFAAVIKVGKVVVVRVATSEPNPHHELYFLGVVRKDLDQSDDVDHRLVWRTTKMEEVGVLGVVNQNTLLMRFQWLWYQPHKRAPPGLEGARGYKFAPAEKIAVHPCFGVATGPTQSPNLAMGKGVRYQGGHYWILPDMHDEIQQDTVDLSP